MSERGRVEIPAPLQAAFELFLDEFDTHLAHFRMLLQKIGERDPSPLSAEEREADRKSIENRCHLIRGSAGFFKLVELRELAANGEKEFRSVPAADYLERAHERLPFLIKELERHATQLRPDEAK